MITTRGLKTSLDFLSFFRSLSLLYHIVKGERTVHMNFRSRVKARSRVKGSNFQGQWEIVHVLSSPNSKKKSRQKVTLRHFLDSKWKIFAIVLHVPSNRVRLKVVISGHSGAIIRELSFKGMLLRKNQNPKRVINFLMSFNSLNLFNVSVRSTTTLTLGS